MISPSIGQDYAEPIAAVYRDAELRILQRIAYSLQQGLDAPGWEQLQLARLQGVRAEVAALLAQVNPEAAALLQSSLDAAYAQGELSAFSDTAGTIDPISAPTLQRQAAVAALASDTARAVGSAQPEILRGIDDVYRQVVADASASVLAGGETRRDATQRALTSLFGKGIHSIQTRGGKLGLPNYVTMAVRTATARAALQGHTDTMTAMGLDLVIIHPGPRACSICDKWARLILTRAKSVGRFDVESVIDGPPVSVLVSATLDAARAAGWGHPNCRCGLKAYLPGITKPAELQRAPWDAEAYALQQQQRGIELQIRSWKQREAVAITPAAQADARAKVTGWQAAMRDHVAAHPDLKRQSKREQINGTLGGSSRATNPPRRGPGSTPLTKGTPKPPAPPASPSARLDGLPRMAKPQTMAQATKGTPSNPGYGLDDSYGVNCSNVVNAVELRVRGIDVIAKPRVGGGSGSGRTDAVIAEEWLTPEGTPAAFRYVDARHGIKGLKYVATDWPVGARGFVTIRWEGGGAHIFNVAKTGPDALQFYEGQTLSTSTQARAYLTSARKGSSYGMIRTDHLTPTDALFDHDVIVASGSAEGRAIIEAGAERAKITADLAAHDLKIAAADDEYYRINRLRILAGSAGKPEAEIAALRAQQDAAAQVAAKLRAAREGIGKTKAELDADKAARIARAAAEEAVKEPAVQLDARRREIARLEAYANVLLETKTYTDPAVVKVMAQLEEKHREVTRLLILIDKLSRS